MPLPPPLLQVWTWGRGEYGRLGIGDKTGSSKLRPKRVQGLEGHCIVQVGGGLGDLVLEGFTAWSLHCASGGGRLGEGMLEGVSAL